ncbi:hypothetical protein KEM56_004687 [Ascosphaera pollenicola]|nr:hypothetical protein KEM56_004687 [Ascosphaera pollenicola]
MSTSRTSLRLLRAGFGLRARSSTSTVRRFTTTSSDGPTTQSPRPSAAQHAPTSQPRKPELELDVGELEGITFKVEPLKRDGEDIATTRARLLYQSRKRGTLETDLLLSTFASAYLPRMDHSQLQTYSSFLDENDWDIYYWATQPAMPSPEAELATAASQPEDQQTSTWKETMAKTKSGEWPSTKGAFKAAYRPVPERWRNSEILRMFREHVKSNSARGLSGPGQGGADDAENGRGKGIGRMPDVPVLDQ